MDSVEFSKNFLMRELDLPWSAIEDEIVDTSRWSVHHSIIFEYKGKFYRTGYSKGATEMQDESPWQDEEFIYCEEVELKEVVVKQWVPVGETRCK